MLLLLLLTSPVAVVCRSPWEVRVIGSEWVWVPAVRSADGYEGVLANLSLVVTEGSGEVYISTSPLAEIDMQGAALTAARVACEVLGLPFHKYNFYYKVYSDSIIIGGPSAGAEMTVLALAVLSGRRINRSVLMTGMINPDGSIGPVGGILEKAEAAAEKGVRRFLVPAGQTIVYRYVRREERLGPFVYVSVTREPVDLVKYARDKWGMEVVEVSNIYEVAREFLGLNIGYMVSYRPELSPDVERYLVEINDNLTAMADAESRTAREYLRRLGGYYGSELMKVWNEGMNYLKKAREPGRYIYERASYAFSSLVKFGWVHYLAMYLLGEDLDREVKRVTKLVKGVKREVREAVNLVNSVSDVDFLLVAVQRASEAERYLDKARESWNRDVRDSLWSLSYARWRAYTVELWLRLMKAREGTFRLDVRELRSIAHSYVSQARAVVSYVNVVAGEGGLVQPLLSEANEYYQEAQRRLVEGDYLSAAVSSIESLVRSEVAMNIINLKIGGLSSEAIQSLLNYTRLRALYSMAKAGKVAEPVVATLYYLYGTEAKDPEEALIRYKLASYYAQLLHDIVSRSKSARLPLLAELHDQTVTC